MSDASNQQLILIIVAGSAIGTTIIEIFFRLFVDHLLKINRYNQRIKSADRRECATELLELINPRHFKERLNLKSDIYNKDFALSDRLETLGEKKYSEKLDNYSALYKHLADRNAAILNFPPNAHYKEIEKDFMKTHSEVDKVRKELLEIAKKLKK